MTNTKEMMTQAGYAVWSTGGGCTCWGKDLNDGTWLSITNGDNGHDSQPDERTWAIHRNDNDTCGYFYTDELTLSEALDLAGVMPSPRFEDEPVQACTSAPFLRIVRLLGLGFHPDTPARDYVDSEGKPALTEEQCRVLEQGIDTITDEADIYEVGFRIWQALGLITANEAGIPEWNPPKRSERERWPGLFAT